MPYILKTPLAFFIFNRPEHTARVFDVISLYKPARLYIIADGPRTDSELEICERTRAITEKINWPCEVKRNYSATNMGCKDRVSSGISWVFDQVDRAIILEDDCLPSPSFFPFCEELLQRYADDENIMSISGDNFLPRGRQLALTDSYYFSRLPHIWGWATWKRAWKLYDKSMSSWPMLKQTRKLHDVFNDFAAEEKWTHTFDQYYAGGISSWDGQWAYACIMNNGISINPRSNLIKNIGFEGVGTHTKNSGCSWTNMVLDQVEFPLKHPNKIVVNNEFDQYILKNNFGIKANTYEWLRTSVKQHFPRTYALALKAKKLFTTS